MITTLPEKIKVMQAFEAGEEIECYSAAAPWWGAAYRPTWDWHTRAYRIKYVPKEIWVNEKPNGLGPRYATRAEADVAASTDRVRCILFREVKE